MLLFVQLPHLPHRDASVEIRRLQLTEQCKCRAEDDDQPLRQIFCRSAADAGQHLSFADIECSMYKRCRRARPALPSSLLDADEAVRNSRYAQLNDGEFYRGSVYAGDNASVVYAIMLRKTQDLYVEVFEKMKELAPQFAPQCAMADYEEASVSAFQQVFDGAGVVGCWFHFAQAIIKRVNKLGLKDAHGHDSHAQETIHCLTSLPLLPAAEITAAVSEIEDQINADSPHATRLRQLLAYVK